MISASAIVYAAAGSPHVNDCAPVSGLCYLCGALVERGMRVEDWMGDGFVGQNRARVPSSPVVCEPCVFVCSRTSPVPGRPPKEGKALGGNFRNYSHVADDDGYRNMSKGEKPALLAWLRSPRRGAWFAAVAESGQKHTVPHCPVNPPGARRGRVLFEERELVLPESFALVDALAYLLTAGATKEEVQRGDYGPRAWGLCADTIRAFERAHGRERGGAWFDLALYLAQRDEDAVVARMAAEKEAKSGKARRGNAGVTVAGDSGRTDGRATHGATAGRVAAETVGPTAIEDAVGGADVREPGRVGNETAARPADRGAVQGAFDFAAPARDAGRAARKRVARPGRA